MNNQKKNKYIKIGLILSAVFMLAVVALGPSLHVVSAQTTAPEGKLINPLKADNIQDLIFYVIDLAMKFGVVLAILMIVWSGFQFIMAQGDPKKLAEARSLFFGVIVGLAVLISAKVIVEVVKQTLIASQVVKPDVFQKTN